jgi:hypothetical protein
MSLYFKILDTILKNKKKSFRKEDWKCMVQISMAIAMALNLMFFLAFFKEIYCSFFYDLEI